jgi:aminomethyltransferase
VYRVHAESFLVCVNASNAEKDFEWMRANHNTSAQIINASAEWGQIAVQGPSAIALVAQLFPGIDSAGLKNFHFLRAPLLGVEVLVARTGYTGEDGVEIFVPAQRTVDLWRLLLEQGAKDGVVPCGLGARDSLRLEAALPLHGHELSEEISALESGLGWIVKFDKGDFIGRAALQRQKECGVPRRLVGFYLDGAGIARHGDGVRAAGSSRDVGVVTSGTKTPTVNVALGMALVASECAVEGGALTLVVRGREIPAHVVRLPFYTRPRAVVK